MRPPATVLQHTARTQAMTAAVALAVMNVADLAVTRVALARGNDELNPVADRLLQSGRLDVVKVGMSLLLLALVARATSHPLHPRTLVLLWLTTAFYAVALCWNAAMLLRFT